MVESTSIRSRGAFVVLVGPDGVGKTTVARELIDAYTGPTAYFHFRPTVLTPLAKAPPDWSPSPPDKGHGEGWRLLGWVRLVRSYLFFWTGYLCRVRPALRRGALVVGDRWAFGYVTQPRSVKFYGPSWLARLALRTLPQPDLVANLRAPADLVHARKQELTLDEIGTELDAWSNLEADAFKSFCNVDEAAGTARQILQALAP